MKSLLSASADSRADPKYVKAAKGYVVDALAWHVKGACGATLVGDGMLLAALSTKAPMVVSQVFMGVSAELLDEVWDLLDAAPEWRIILVQLRVLWDVEEDTLQVWGWTPEREVP